MSDTKGKINLAVACTDKATLLSYLREKGENHHNYKFYHCKERIDSILSTSKLYLSTGETWNDTFDRQSFNSDENDELNFGMCFSFSKLENVAMWMLYGGLKRKGCMLDINRANMNKILTSVDSVECGNFVEGKGFVPLQKIKKGDYEIKLIDIIYYSDENENYYRIKRADEVFKEAKKSVINEVKMCKKHHPWNYENECRLVVTINKKLIDKKVTALCIDIPKNVIKDLRGRVVSAPNFEGENDFIPSSMKGEVDWQLCAAICLETNTESKFISTIK